MTSKLSVPALPKGANQTGSRRKFLKAAGGAAAVGATLGFPMIAKGQTGPISMAIQVIALALLYIFPGIGLWLPHVLYK